MPAEICFDLDGKRVCIPIYYMIPWAPWKPPDPDPDPWRQDIYQIAIISQLTQGLSERVRKPVAQGVVNAAKELQGQLPKGLNFNLHGHAQGG